ncbi:MAG: RHS repeat-associated core domain-containing protein [Bacteroidota bacterium]
MKIHRQGKGILGFEQVVMEDSHLNIKTETNSGYDSTYFFPIVLTTKSYANNDPVKETKNTWDKQVTKSVTGLDPIFPYLSYTLNRNILEGFQDSTTFVYDSTIKGSLKETKQKFDNGVTQTITNTYFANDETNWYIGRLKESIVEHEKSNETTISRKTTYTYSTDGKLKPDFVKYLEGTSWYVYKNYDYNAQGNVTQEYAYSNNGGARQTNYTYENDHVRVKTVTSPLGHVTTFTYDTYGRKATEKDYLNNTTSYVYDNFGRVNTVTQPDGFVSTTAYSWGLSGGPANACYNIQQSGNDGSLTKTWYDKLSRQLRSDVKGFSGSTYIYTATEYNSQGQVYRVSEPSFNPAPTLWNVFTYDNYGRQQNITRPSGRNTAYSYGTGSSRVTESTGGITSWKETNSQGLLTAANDDGGTITYSYYPDGNLKSIHSPGGVQTAMEYDIAGNQIKLIDPSAGTIEYSWNAYGQMLTQKNARNQITEYTYLADGRLNTKSTPEGIESYGYNTNQQLTGITNPGTGVNRGYAYDSKGRVQQITQTIASKNFSTNFTYDNLGRLSTRTHPSGIVETNNYNSNGYLASISAGGATRFTVTAMNERQQITAATYGTGLTGDFGYNSYGYPTHAKAHVSGTYRQDYRYEFNTVTGNLNWRKNHLRNLTESFTYDDLDRLLTITGPQDLTLNYAANGNITVRSDLGTTNQFIYGNNARPYQLTSIEVDSALQIVPETLQQLAYTSFEQPSVITEIPYQATFVYNTEGQRARMAITQNGSTILTRWYAGSRFLLETAGSTNKEYTWIGGDAYTAPCVAIKTSTGSHIYYYLLRDHLGTITHVTNSSGTVQNEYSYDAWGIRRNFSNWSYAVAAQTDLLPARGFTGHEWLPWFNLYNMNGRLYDPVVGRFLSPDNYVQMPDFSQNFNRYSYCLNNPLKYTDPTGEFWHLIIGAAIGGIVNWATHGAEFSWEGLGYFGIGAAAGALGAGVGAGISSAMAGGSFGAGFIGSSAAMTATTSFATGAAIGGGAGFSAGFTTGFGNGLIGGQNFGQALWSGTKDGLIGGASGALLGGLAGGIDATADGRNFWHGGTRTVDVSLPIPQVNQAGQYDCNYACAESVDSYYGNGRNQSYFQTLEPGNGQGLTDVEIGRMYGKAGYGARPISINTSNPVSTAGDIANTMSANKAVVLNYNTGISGGVNSAGQRIVFGHATVVTRVRIFDNGRFIINVMNPGGSTTRFTNANLFHLIFGVY